MTYGACLLGIAANDNEMDKTLLAEATRIKAGAGGQRAFLVGSMDFPEGGQRAEQTQQIVECIYAAGLHVDIDDVVFGPGSNDSRVKYCDVKMVATISDDASDGTKRVAEAFPHALTLPFWLAGLGGFHFSGVKHANLTRLPWGGAVS